MKIKKFDIIQITDENLKTFLLSNYFEGVSPSNWNNIKDDIFLFTGDYEFELTTVKYIGNVIHSVDHFLEAELMKDAFNTYKNKTECEEQKDFKDK
jgi:hypothetical protein